MLPAGLMDLRFIYTESSSLKAKVYNRQFKKLSGSQKSCKPVTVKFLHQSAVVRSNFKKRCQLSAKSSNYKCNKVLQHYVLLATLHLIIHTVGFTFYILRQTSYHTNKQNTSYINTIEQNNSGINFTYHLLSLHEHHGRIDK